MDDTFKIRPYHSTDSMLLIGGSTAGKLRIRSRKRGYVSFGSGKHYVDIKVSNTLSENEILLSEKVINYLHIPPHINYEVKVKDNEIALGPYIGILASEKHANISKERLEHVEKSIQDYHRLNGVITVFALDGVETSGHLIKGYYFNPVSKSWDEAVLPYPSAIYRTIGLNETWQNHFLSVIGDNLFNGRYFDKWEMYEWYSREKNIAEHLPHTILLRSSRDIMYMLEKHKEVYVKPKWGMKGHGVVKISLSGQDIIFEFRKDKKNNRITAGTWPEAEVEIKKLFTPSDYIIQQGIDLLRSESGVIDLRVVMQKSHGDEWLCSAMVARIGAKESVVSNISSGGRGSEPGEILKEVLHLNRREISLFREEIIEFCLDVCMALDEFGIRCGTLGIDLGIDKQGKIWLIEINHRSPHPAIVLLIDDINSYNTIISSPLYYAKFLAGF